MKERTKEQQQLMDWDNELRFESLEYSDTKVCDIAKTACEFAYDNFKTKEELYEGYQYEFETKITNVALGIDSHLQKNIKNKKSSVIKKFILDTINKEKYLAGRSGFIFLLSVMKMDEELKQIATDKKELWKAQRIEFQLLYSLYKRKIKGFKEQAQQLIEDNPKERELMKYAKKYIEQEHKYGNGTN